MLSSELTARELRKYAASLKTANMYKITDDALELPDYGFDEVVTRSDVRAIYEVHGIEDEYYSKLNNTRVYEWNWRGISGNPSNLVRRRRKSYNRLDTTEDGREILDRMEKPDKSSVGVLSPVNIELPYEYNGQKDAGLAYADRWDESGRQEYGYYIPKKYLYKVHLTSLVLAQVNNAGGGYGTINAYAGKVYPTWQFGRVLIAVTPYTKPTQYDGDPSILRRRNRVRVCGAKVGDNWNDEFYALTQNLVEQGIIPHLDELGVISGDDQSFMVQDYVTMDEPYQEVDYVSLADSEAARGGAYIG